VDRWQRGQLRAALHPPVVVKYSAAATLGASHDSLTSVPEVKDAAPAVSLAVVGPWVPLETLIHLRDRLVVHAIDAYGATSVVDKRDGAGEDPSA
jgi:hypothetical protein